MRVGQSYPAGEPMRREENDQLAACADCRAVISVSGARGYAFGTGGILCWDCAVRRGGRYDEAGDRWSSPPRVADLLERERDLR